MKHLKNRLEFINESDKSVEDYNWAKVEDFIKAVKADFQFDDTIVDYLGFINLDPTEITIGPFRNIHEYLKADIHEQNQLDVLLEKYGLAAESAHEDEVIIGEIHNLHTDDDISEYLKNRNCILTDNGWNCPIFLNLQNNRTPLIKKGKLQVQINSANGIRTEKCNLTTLEGFPRTVKDIDIGIGNYLNPFMIKWYENNKGYNDFWMDFLQHMIKNYPNSIDNIEWPEGFLDENLKKSARGLGRFDL